MGLADFCSVGDDASVLTFVVPLVDFRANFERSRLQREDQRERSELMASMCWEKSLETLGMHKHIMPMLASTVLCVGRTC